MNEGDVIGRVGLHTATGVAVELSDYLGVPRVISAPRYYG